MRKRITPSPAVLSAWTESQRLRQNAGRLWENSDLGMGFAADLLKREEFKKEEAAARAVLLTAVVKSHGPKTVIEWEPNGFTLWGLEAHASAA